MIYAERYWYANRFLISGASMRLLNIDHLNEQLEIEGYQAYCLVALLKFNDIVWGATNDFT